MNCEVLKLKMELPNKIDGVIDSNGGPLILELFPIGCCRYNRYENSIFYLSPIYIYFLEKRDITSINGIGK